MEQNKLPSVAELHELEGKFVFLRTSLNVPVKDGKVSNDFRIVQSLPTIKFLIERGAKVILCSHLGRSADESIAPVVEVLQKHIHVEFSPEVTGPISTQKCNELQNGQVLLLENVRRDAREVENDPVFAMELASLADIFVNDDFAASHREHASLHAICKLLPSYAGLNCIHEYEELSKVMNPSSPSLFVLGGAKFETKMPLVEKYLDIYDHICIGGALVNDFLKAKGYEVGTSLVSDVSLEGSHLLTHPKILLPVDVLAVKDGVRRIADIADVHSDESILDAGPKTIELLTPYIQNAKTILWNGPLGNYENGYQDQTVACAKLIASASAYTVVGGGDTVAAIEALQSSDKYDFLSTAGGAMLTFLELGSLPALDALIASDRA
jgi:phosphoglycerate kinase